MRELKYRNKDGKLVSTLAETTPGYTVEFTHTKDMSDVHTTQLPPKRAAMLGITY